MKRPRGGGLEIVADGRADWIGWIDLKREEVNEVATQNTARVINELDAAVWESSRLRAGPHSSDSPTTC